METNPLVCLLPMPRCVQLCRDHLPGGRSRQPLLAERQPASDTKNFQEVVVTAQTASSRFLDLDLNNIENITVPKGLAATVTYGDQGAILPILTPATALS